MWRLVILILCSLTLGCDSESAPATGSDTPSTSFTGSDSTSPPAPEGDDIATPRDNDVTEPVEVPCELSTGMCPNACAHGDSEAGGGCVTDSDCGCGLCCGFGQCKAFDAQGCESYASYAGCLCQGEEPGSGPVDPTDDTPWQVDPISYMDGNCSSATPVGSTCNPFCQLGCPADAHCALVDDERFTCVTSGSGQAGAHCENSSQCAPWLSCFGTFDASSDTCHTVCDADEECPGGQACNLTIQFTSMGSVSFCDTAVLSCNIWMSDCPSGMKCVLSAGQTICSESTWDGIEGYPCTELGDCQPGLQCIGVACAPICSTADSPPLGAMPWSELCPGDWQTVNQTLDIGRCSTADQQ